MTTVTIGHENPLINQATVYNLDEHASKAFDQFAKSEPSVEQTREWLEQNGGNNGYTCTTGFGSNHYVVQKSDAAGREVVGDIETFPHAPSYRKETWAQKNGTLVSKWMKGPGMDHSFVEEKEQYDDQGNLTRRTVNLDGRLQETSYQNGQPAPA